MADLDRRLEAERAATLGARVALDGLANIGEARIEVATRLDPEQMPAVAIRTGDELPAAKRIVGDDLDVGADRPQRASTRRRQP